MHITSYRGKHGAGSGFSLFELAVTLAILGILAAFAYPSYTSYVARGKRSAAKSFMLDVATRQERYLLDARQYAPDLATLGMTLPDSVSPNYTVTLINVTATPPGYVVQAVPIGVQAQVDTGCGTLTVDNANNKGATGATGATDCWNR